MNWQITRSVVFNTGLYAAGVLAGIGIGQLNGHLTVIGTLAGVMIILLLDRGER